MDVIYGDPTQSTSRVMNDLHDFHNFELATERWNLLKLGFSVANHTLASCVFIERSVKQSTAR